MDTALYFPYIDVPQTPWFTQVLLYWDRAASIVPQSRLGQPISRSPYMRALAREQLLEYVHPDSELYLRSEAFDRAFLELLGPPQDPLVKRTFVKLHIEKMSGSLFHALRDRGLAKYEKGPEWAAWWHVEVNTAHLYMAYLACAISGARSETSETSRTLPVTDREQAIGTLAEGSADLQSQLARLRYAAITQALPAPKGPVPAAKLKAFKEDNSEKLRRCRTFLDDKLADLAAMTDPKQREVREVKAAQIMQELEDDVKSLQERMNKRRWPGVVLVGFGGVMGAALATAATVATGGAALAVGLGVGAGLLQTGGAGYAAVKLMRRPRYDPRAPLAYAALASRL
jgi:hypothetical protein